MLFYHSNYSVEQCDKLRILHLSHPQGSPLNFPFSSSMLLCYQILCIFSLLHFTPPCGFMLFSIIYIFFFFLTNALFLPHTPHFSTSFITSSTTFIPSPPLIHTVTPVSSLFSFHYNLQLPPHWDPNTHDK